MAPGRPAFHTGEAAILEFSLILLSCTADKEFSCNEPLKFIDILFLLHRWHIVLYQMRNSLNSQSAVCILYSVFSVYFVPSLQSAFCIWSAVCILNPVCSLHFVPGLLSAFYIQSAGCILYPVCRLHFVPDLHAAFCTRSAGCILYWVDQNSAAVFLCYQRQIHRFPPRWLWDWGRLRQKVLVGRQNEHFESSAGFLTKGHQLTNHHHGANIVNTLYSDNKSPSQT